MIAQLDLALANHPGQYPSGFSRKRLDGVARQQHMAVHLKNKQR